MDYDGLILGAGHNALVLQAYLCRAGLKVACIERRAVGGGGLTTEEHSPGFLHNTHSFYHRALTQMPWYRDLDLERRGARYIEPELNVALLTRDGEALEWWTDFEKTCGSIARFSRRDAATARRWRDAFEPIVERILTPEAQAPPLPPDQRRALLARSAAGRLLLDTSQLSPREFVLREFEHPVVQAGLLFFNGLREVDLREKGFGHHIPALLASKNKAQMCRGGSAQLARALVDAIEEAGGDILLATEPTQILVEGDRAVGVETRDGQRLKARHFVASSLNPQQTFLDLLPPEVLPQAWRDKAAAFRYNLLAPLFGLYLELEEAPMHRAAEAYPHLKQSFMVILGLDSPANFDAMLHHHKAGSMPPPVTWGSTPTLFDPSQAPPGQHTAFMWEKLPYALGNDPARWDVVKEVRGRQLLSHWAEHAPNIPDVLIDSFVRSPLDVERTLPNMYRGDLLVGAFAVDQVGYHRPFPGAGHYRGHLAGLYLCGSSCHPGGNITGLPGYNCAQVLFADLGLPGP